MQELRSYKGFNSSTYALYTAAFPWCNFQDIFFGTSHIIGLSINIIKSLATIAISRTGAIPCLNAFCFSKNIKITTEFKIQCQGEYQYEYEEWSVLKPEI